MNPVYTEFFNAGHGDLRCCADICCVDVCGCAGVCGCAERATMEYCWEIHDRMTIKAEKWRKTALCFQFLVTTLSLSAIIAAIIYSQFDRDTVSARAHHIRLASTILPVVAAFLLPVQASFGPVMKWARCLHAAANAKSQIFKYRARAGSYAKSTGYNSVQPIGARALLATSVGQLDTGVSQGEFSDHAPPTLGLKQPLLGCFGIEPTQRPISRFLGHQDDDGTSMLDPSQYIQFRCMTLKAQLGSNALSLAMQLRVFRICVILSTFSPLLLGVLDLNGWIPVCISLGASFQAWIDFQSLPGRLANVSNAITTLKKCASAVPGTPANFSHLIHMVEECASAEASAITQSSAKTDRPTQGGEEGGDAKGEASESKSEGGKQEKNTKANNDVSSFPTLLDPLDFVQRGTPANFSHVINIVEECASAEASAIVQSSGKTDRPTQGFEEGGDAKGEASESKSQGGKQEKNTKAN